MTVSRNEDLVRAYVEALNAFDMVRLREIFAPVPKIWGVLGHGGFDVVEPIWSELHHGMSMRLEILDMIATEDRAAVRYRETGRFVGPFRGLPGAPPTGRTYEVTAMEGFEFTDGRISARWGARDSAAISRQVLG